MTSDRIQPGLADAANVPPTPHWVNQKKKQQLDNLQNYTLSSFLLAPAENTDFCWFVSHVKNNLLTSQNGLNRLCDQPTWPTWCLSLHGRQQDIVVIKSSHSCVFIVSAHVARCTLVSLRARSVTCPGNFRIFHPCPIYKNNLGS